MIRNGKPFIPPGCPVDRQGKLPDLATDPFEFIIAPDNYDGQRGRGIYAIFGERGEDYNFTNSVYLAGIIVPEYSALAEKTYQILGVPESSARGYAGASSTENPNVQQLREVLCDRIANCRGLIEGECWALGSLAFQEVIEQLPLSEA